MKTPLAFSIGIVLGTPMAALIEGWEQAAVLSMAMIYGAWAFWALNRFLPIRVQK